MADYRPRPTALARRLRNNATDAERHLWRRLSRRRLAGFKFSRRMPAGQFVYDSTCREAGLVIELDGGQNDQRSREDMARTHRIEAEGCRVLRFWNNDVFWNIEGALGTILRTLKSTDPSPFPQAGGVKE